MTREQILKEALTLDAVERERFADELWQSVDETTREPGVGPKSRPAFAATG
jgi:hypothetical protein